MWHLYHSWQGAIFSALIEIFNPRYIVIRQIENAVLI
jgi:hypothetical protein